MNKRMVALNSHLPMKDWTDQHRLRRQGYEQFGAVIHGYKAYANAGSNRITFFDQQASQVGTEVCNLPEAGRMKIGDHLLQTHVAIDVQIVGDPATFGAESAADIVNAYNRIMNSGNLVFTYDGDKRYHDAGPIKNYPMPGRMGGLLAVDDQSTIANNLQTKVQAVAHVGHVFELPVPLLLEPQIAFEWFLEWKNPVALPGALTANIGVHVGGLLRRLNTRG